MHGLMPIIQHLKKISDLSKKKKEDLWRIVGLLEEATAAVTRRIKTSVIPDAEDRPCLDPKFGMQTLHSKCPVTL
jgi:hypothetical protein